MSLQELTERERRVLEAVIESYVETAEPAGSNTLAKRFGLGVSAATIRNTMSDLEEKGFLFIPHTSAGRMPTDRAYRLYVDSLMPVATARSRDHDELAAQIAHGGSAIESILRRAAQSLSVLTQELGVALGPSLDQAILQRVELVRVSSERLLAVLTLRGGAMRTIFIEVPGEIAEGAVAHVTSVINERLAGLTLREIRSSLGERLRDVPDGGGSGELLNIFIQEGDSVFDVSIPAAEDDLVLGQASVLADKPEFATGPGMRQILALTETRDRLRALLRKRSDRPGVTITIGAEHGDPSLENFTLVTAEYHAGTLSGVIGVIGPTRMPYDKVISLVSHTSRLVSEVLE